MMTDSVGFATEGRGEGEKDLNATRFHGGKKWLHRLFAELIPGGAPRDLSATKAKVLLAGVRPRDQVGKTRRRMAAEQVRELVRLDAQMKASKAELNPSPPSSSRSKRLRIIALLTRKLDPSRSGCDF